MRNLVIDPKTLPISFRLGDTNYRGMPGDVKTCTENGKITYTSMLGELEVKAVCVSYDDYDASEWTVYFTNNGSTPSPRLSDVNVIDHTFEGENHKIITCNGDCRSDIGYSSTETHLGCGAFLRLRPLGGKSTECAFPYQRILFDGWCVNLAIGWPGTWKCSFTGTDDGVRYTAGQDVFDTVVLPGETLRTPLIVVVACEGDYDAAVNVWRRWYLKHVGTAKPYLHGSWHGGGLEYTHATEEGQLTAIRNAVKNKVGINLWWVDAGWYPAKSDSGEDNWWGTVGDWEPDAGRFPHGLEPIGAECEKNGLDFLLWFEAERVTVNSKVRKEHPEWVIEFPELTQEWMLDWGRDLLRILDLSIPACVEDLTKRIGDCIEKNHVKVYRQDCNFEPELCFRMLDTEDRRGAFENLYEQGLLRYWDGLKARFPYLQIDSCAAGGMRNDIEMMRRAVPMHQTDACYGIQPVQQAFAQTLYTWIPYFRGFAQCWEKEDGSYDEGKPPKKLPPFDEYTMICSLAPIVGFGGFTYPGVPEEALAPARKYAELFHRAAPMLCTGDFYALTPYHKSRRRWTAWQFDKPEENRGIIEVIRNNAAPDETLTVAPHLPDGSYLFKDLWTGETFRYEGGPLTFRQPLRSAKVWEYTKI